jgi:hypothetical protein
MIRPRPDADSEHGTTPITGDPITQIARVQRDSASTITRREQLAPNGSYAPHILATNRWVKRFVRRP